jgi:hypothetical protein
MRSFLFVDWSLCNCLFCLSSYQTVSNSTTNSPTNIAKLARHSISAISYYYYWLTFILNGFIIALEVKISIAIEPKGRGLQTREAMKRMRKKHYRKKLYPIYTKRIELRFTRCLLAPLT